MHRYRQQVATAAARLTAREREVVACISKGLTNPEIGRALGVSRYTVKQHVSHVLEKLEAADRREAADRARALGYL